MPRARNIKYGFFTNELLAECSIEARLCFIGLWTLADWKGRLEYRPGKIKILLFPADNVDCASLLDELESRGFISYYQVGDKTYIWIPKFTAHQSPHHKEKAVSSMFPAHPDDNTDENRQQPGASTVLTRGKPGASTVITPCQHALNPDILNPECGILNPDPPPTPQGVEKVDHLCGFDQFWQAYPKKMNKPDAQKAYKQVKAAQHLPDILNSLEKHKAWSGWTKDGGQFIPYPASWLRATGWENEMEITGLARLGMAVGSDTSWD